MQFKKAAMTQITQSGIRHGGKTVVSNENIAKPFRATNVPTWNLLYLQELLVFF